MPAVQGRRPFGGDSRRRGAGLVGSGLPGIVPSRGSCRRGEYAVAQGPSALAGQSVAGLEFDAVPARSVDEQVGALERRLELCP